MSCTTKLQHPRLFPAFARSIANKAKPRAAQILPSLKNDGDAEQVSFKYFDQDEQGQLKPADTEREERIGKNLDVAQKALEEELERLGGNKDFKGDVEGSFEEQLEVFDTLKNDLGLPKIQPRECVEDFNPTNVLGGLDADEKMLFDKMLAAFDARAKNAGSIKGLDMDDEADIIKDFTPVEKKVYHTMLESMGQLTQKELIGEQQMEELKKAEIRIPELTSRETEVAQELDATPLEGVAAETQLQQDQNSKPWKSGRKRRHIRSQPEAEETKSLDGYTIPRANLPREGQAYVSKLNEAIEKAIENPTKHRKELWRWYSLSWKTLNRSPGQVPAGTWDLLWDEFSLESLDNPDRMAHISAVAADMEAANAPLNVEQSLLHIEALFIENQQKDALAKWEAARSSMTLVDTTAASYWALGLRMLAQLKQPARAQEAADMLLNNLNAKEEARSLITLIRAWSEYKDKTAVQLAWAMYVRFKFWMGSSMEMQDYDDVAGIFLAAEETDLALAVFRDMMMTDDPLAKQLDSITLHQRLTGIKPTKDLKSFVVAPEETAWKSSEHLSVLPANRRNKFFFGSWIKKLLGEGEIDWAAQVVELMSQKGIRPSATFLNGIIGAHFRTGTEANLEKGTTMAWKMIASRLEFVRQRSQQRELNLEGPLRAVAIDGKSDHTRPSSYQVAASATLETFSVLIEHYQGLGQKSRVQELLSTLSAAQIRPTTPFVNSLLELGTAIHHRPWVWSIYERFCQQEGVLATQYTLAILWKNMKDHVDPVVNRSKAGFPGPRMLVREMGRSATWRSETMARELYDQIILCFGLNDDQLGTAVVLRLMQKQYRVMPNEVTVRSVVLQLAKVGVTNVKGYRTRRLNLNKDTQRRINDIGNVMKTLKEQRVKELEAQGVNPERMSQDEQGEESLKLLISLLKFAMERRLMADNALRASAGVGGIDYLARVAQKDMGAEDMPLPWSV